MDESDNLVGISEMDPGFDIEALSNDSRISAELVLLGNEIVAAEPRVMPRRRRLAGRPAVVVATVVALGLGGGAVAAATSSGFGLYSGYVGTDTLIDTTTWRPEWEARIDAYRWPRGFDGESYVAGQVAGGLSRPDGVPSQDLDRELLAVNACAWVAAYEHRLADGDEAGQRAAAIAIEEALLKPVNEPFVGEHPVTEITAITVDPEPDPVAFRDFRSTICDHGLVADAIAGAL